MSTQPRIRFKALKGFPPIHEKKIETESFLEAAKEVVTVIESFGKIFTPVISDMNGNIAKLTKVYGKDKTKYFYLDDMIIFNKLTKVYGKDKTKYFYLDDMIIFNVNVDNFAADALLWLKRGLQLICIFFENIFYDTHGTDILKLHLQNAYDRTLKPYHGFIVQSTVKIIYSWIPTRSQLIGQGEAHDENVQVMEKYLQVMRCHLDHIDGLLKRYNLEDAKV